MDCQTFKQAYVELLDAPLAENVRIAESPLQNDLRAHLASCPECARHFKTVQAVATRLQPSPADQPNPRLKETIMNRIYAMEATPAPLPIDRLAGSFKLWRPLLAAAALVLVVTGASIMIRELRPGRPGGGQPGFSSHLSLVATAAAAEARNFSGPGGVHIVNEIIIDPISDPGLAGSRWLPLTLLEANGNTNFSWLSLPAAAGQSYTISDEVWSDPATGRFKRIMMKEGRPVYATAYDGNALLTLDPSKPGAFTRQPVTATFKPPRNAAVLLGICAGLPLNLTQLNESDLTDAGEEKLEGVGMVRRLKLVQPGPDGKAEVWWIFKIRSSDTTLVGMDFYNRETRMLSIRRVKAEPVAAASVAWNLDGLASGGRPAVGAPMPSIDKDMVRPDVSVKNMVERASFETYLFAKDPAWTSPRTITDVRDPASFGQRMFVIVHKAADHRHVVLVQSPTYNNLLGPKVKTGKMIYQSLNGFKVWSNNEERNKWLAGILLASARAWTGEKPAENRTGYMLESPAGTFPALAVNGPISEAELRALVDSLVPAKQF